MTAGSGGGTETFTKMFTETFTRVPGESTIPTVTGPVMPSHLAPSSTAISPLPPTLWQRVKALPPWALVGGAAAVVLAGGLLLKGGR